MTAAKKRSDLDEILSRVCVCRLFNLSGLQNTLKRTGIVIDPVQIIWQVGELNAKDLVRLDRNFSNYMVVDDKEEIQAARQALQKDSKFCEFHVAWRDWYNREYPPHFHIENLAALLYHDAVYHQFCVKKDKLLLEVLQEKLYQYLDMYCREMAKKSQVLWTYRGDDFPQVFVKFVYTLRGDVSNIVASYPIKLRQKIQELDLFKNVLSDENRKEFIAFLDALNR